MRVLVVPPGGESLRLDVFVSRSLPVASRRTVRDAIATGAVRVNGRRGRKGQVVGPGDTVEVPETLGGASTLQANADLRLPVLYEDAELIAVDKPAGMPSHALRADETDTAANFLLARCPEMAAVGTHPLEAGLVHRLDTDTSGVLLAARTVAAHAALRRQFAARRVVKEYVAVVQGDVATPGVVRTPIAHERHNRRKMRVCPANTRRTDARPAYTEYRPLEQLGMQTVLAVRITTGVMHQIRVHLASIGHPVVGDGLYGGAVPGVGRHLLHASRIAFDHPVSGVGVDVASPLPAEFTAVLEALRMQRRA